MKLKLIFLYLAGLLASFSLSNAQRLTVRGQVIDEIDNEALPFTQIAIYNITDSTIITGGIANESGVFEISDLNPGQFRAELSFIGYDPLIISPLVLTTGTRVYDLGVLTLRLSKNLLDEIEIVGQVPTTIRRLEKQVYNANQFQQALGGTSLDILKSIPSVNVSPDGDVTLRGTGGFMVYLNGKPAMIDPSVLLATISANSISTVEIITVPTASYNAEGKGGIININTRKSAMQGTNVSGTLMSGGTPVNKEFDPIRYGGSLGISHTKNKLTLFAGIDYSRRNVRASREGKARLLQEDDTYYWMVAEGPKPEWYINFGGRLGAEIELSEKESLSFGFYSGAKTDGRIAEYIYDNFYGDIHENRINNPRNIIILNSNNSERMGSFNSLSADYSRKFSNAAEISLSLLYEHSRLWTDLKNKDISLGT